MPFDNLLSRFRPHKKNAKNNKILSIKNDLVNSITLMFAIIIFGIYLAVDISLDSWVDEQFDKALVNKSNYLKSLVKPKGEQIELEFDDEFMPEFSELIEPQYFQLWLGDETIERSRSLATYSDVDLIREELPLNTTKLIDVRLPNGEFGRAVISNFKDNDDFQIPEPIYLTIYEPTASVERFLVIIDTLLVVTFFLSIFLMRTIAVSIVERGLKPLAHLNQQIKSLDVNRSSELQGYDPIGVPETIYEEVEPIRREINAYIEENNKLIASEKRLTGDIAHELKTPIAEMISLSEVYINFPDDERIGKTYKQDMFNISLRMKKIVDNLLLLQRSASASMTSQYEVIDTDDLLLQGMQDLRFKFPNIQQRVQADCQIQTIVADHFCIYTILTNLIDNALYYSPENTLIALSFYAIDDLGAENPSPRAGIKVRNQLIHPLTEQDKLNLLEPLYQSDSSRTRNDRYGLGLSIIHNICKQQDYQLSVNHDNPTCIEFRITNIELS
ncbi:HAMP domain-containing sensor histidine kinase [Photobacterium arenosum]|uniref:HAMP domain-containing sensor histidine kinase n=1 Tax=Photobacterium arenosum TaxID=2774143 RepID=UPI00288A5104|nr:HAMP domain-containing sensor histidine kinase [Photobacterium arenosum]